ncbi:LysM domain-containing protein [Desulfocicer vacuolatum DSM 3385]|uniref:LysM domain-containing protein n=1 Tax=Desulfocicer vacuolatum DSM 3385 TaxID=1121400 RepID=A0A1W2D9L1_9BACT|nr:lytic transglycosylase domain-containing protein [Desulfocicer vacuolatum]SMC93836.1 LysM domain-containing protein [Desulfocicer vacuolatum DSM 3385]
MKFMGRFIKSIGMLFIFFGAAAFCPANASDTSVLIQSELPDLVGATRFTGPILVAGEPVPTDIPRIREGLEKEILLTLWNRSQVLLWMKRSSRIFPPIEAILKKQGLPDDLKYVAVVESALRPHAGSSKGAVGYWQFIKSTALKYGLEVNGCVDDRRNLLRSTRAACAYLKKLHGQFGSWALALAAYNMGENGLAAAIEVQEVNDYYFLYLSLETRRYLLKIAAVKMIMQAPEKYGFILTKNDYYPPEFHDRVQFASPGRLNLNLVARAAHTVFKEIKDLNPELRGNFLCKRTYDIVIPRGEGKGFYKRFKPLVAQWMVKNNRKIHVVKKGENLTMIARKYGISVLTLLQWNNLTFKNYIHPGDVLVVGGRKK